MVPSIQTAFDSAVVLSFVSFLSSVPFFEDKASLRSERITLVYLFVDEQDLPTKLPFAIPL